MLDMKFLRENPDLVKENIKKKFQDEKLPLVDEVIELDAKNRAAITEASELRASRNALSKQIGMLMGQAKKDPSKLEEAEKTPLLKRFFEQMADPMGIMLIVAAVISALTGMVKGEPDFADVAIIMFVVIVNSVLGVVQEAKSEEALEALQEMSAAQSKVLRDGKLVHLPSAELVPGDVIMLEAGDSVPADCRVLESATMKIEEAALTGESVPVTKAVELLTGGDVPLGDRKNMCYMGSTVVYGRGTSVITATGMDTRWARSPTLWPPP